MDLWALVTEGWGDQYHVANGSSSGRMVEGLVDLVEVLGLGDEPSCLQTDLSIRPIVPSSL